jgi:hypothetical protein
VLADDGHGGRFGWGGGIRGMGCGVR